MSTRNKQPQPIIMKQDFLDAGKLFLLIFYWLDWPMRKLVPRLGLRIMAYFLAIPALEKCGAYVIHEVFLPQNAALLRPTFWLPMKGTFNLWHPPYQLGTLTWFFFLALGFTAWGFGATNKNKRWWLVWAGYWLVWVTLWSPF